MRRVLAALFCAAALPALAQTAPPHLQRGINLEIWQSWPSVADMRADPARLNPYPEWRKTFGAAELSYLRAAGFDFVRIPFDPAPLLGFPAQQGALIASMTDSVHLAQNAGLTVIVDLHAFPRGAGEYGVDDILADAEIWQAYLGLTARLGAALADMPPARTLFELLNEPTIDCEAIAAGTAQRWPALLADLHAAARSAAPDLPLVVSGACWGGAWGLAALPADHPVMGDDNVIFSFHDYGPFLYTHQGASWTTGPEQVLTGLPYPPHSLTDAQAETLVQSAQAGAFGADDLRAAIKNYRRNGTAQLSADITRAAEWADANGIARNRVILGEFGAIWPEGAANLGRAQFLADKTRAAEAAGFAWAVWNVAGSGGFGLTGAGYTLPADVCAALGLTCR